ncbi:MAG TPA: YbjN domain-containing protein [Actinomycetota bacterium]|nr:YbjN domain-containing protein [Actinomycetota bacterium]
MIVADLLERFFTQMEIPFVRASETQYAFQLRGERKLTIPVSVTISPSAIRFESFFMRKPQDNLVEFYEMLLRRNARAYGVSFGLDGVGDVYLVHQRAVDGLNEHELDRIIGALLIEADGSFDHAIALGFEQYLARDRAWRARGGDTPG